MWTSGGLHNMICKTSNCYRPSTVCRCKLCGLSADRLRYLEECAWAGADDNKINITPRNIKKKNYILHYLMQLSYVKI